MADPAEFHSSDIEFSPVQKRFAHAGERSIASMRDTLFEDRISSKKTIRTLTDSRGAASTQYARTLWMNRLDSYIERNSKNVDLETGPDLETLLRFLDTLVKHLNARSKETKVPLRSTIRRGVSFLMSGLTFRHAKFTLSKHECARIDALIDGMAENGTLARGRAREQLQWVGISIVEKMSRAWLQAALDYGCRSWDIVIQKALTVVLQSALCCRGGEIGRSRGYTVEYMKWKHLAMKLPPGSSSLDDVHLECTIAHEKGTKRETNMNRTIPLSTLRDPSMNVICPVKLLLVQALRSGNLASLEGAIREASLRQDRTIQWVFPERPVMPQFQKMSPFITWDQSAHVGQLNISTKQLGATAGILAELRGHDIRRGAFRDVANLKRTSSDEPFGIATRETAKIVGHGSTSFLNGTTDGYVGDVERDAFTPRAEQMFASRKAPVVGAPLKKRRLTPQEVTAYSKDHEMDATSSKNRLQARTQLHHQQREEWLTSAHANSWTSSNPEKLEMVPSATDETLPIDPRLLLDDDSACKAVTDGTLDAIVYRDPTMVGDDECSDNSETIALGILLDDVGRQDKSSLLTLSGQDFVVALSQINIVRNDTLSANLHHGDHVYAEHCPMGNSRDHPTLYVFRCDKCTQYTSTSSAYLRTHQLACRGSQIFHEKQISCPHEDCESTFGTEKLLQQHLDGVHSFVPQTCPVADCEDEKEFKNRQALQRHLKFKHRPLEPASRCSFPGCVSSHIFDQLANLQAHLKQVHGLVLLAAQKPYLPESVPVAPSIGAAYSFEPTACHIGGTPKCSTVFKRACDLSRHLIRTHGQARLDVTQYVRGLAKEGEREDE